MGFANLQCEGREANNNSVVYSGMQIQAHQLSYSEKSDKGASETSAAGAPTLLVQ